MSREEAFKLGEARRLELRAERIRSDGRVLIIPVGAAMVRALRNYCLHKSTVCYMCTVQYTLSIYSKNIL